MNLRLPRHKPVISAVLLWLGALMGCLWALLIWVWTR